MSIFSTPPLKKPAVEDSPPPGAEEILDQPLFEDQNNLPGFAQMPERVLAKPAKPVPLPNAAIAEQVGILLCPRCQGKLIDPQGMGWCRACGYCKSIEDDKNNPSLEKKPAARKTSGLGIEEFFILLTKIPAWVYLLLLGCGGVFAASLVPAKQLPLDSLLRATWCTAQIGVGLAMIFVAQVIMLLVLAPMDEKLSFKDAVIPFRLWGLAVQRGGRFRVPYWLAGWGLSAIIAAVVVVGGLEYWYRYLPRSKPPEPAPEAAPAPKKR